MNSPPSKAPPDETTNVTAATEGNSVMELVGKLVDAATVLVLVTAGLYFWGHIYFTGFCERLGVSFQGIALPLEDYLIVNWLTVIMLIFAVASGFLILYFVREIAAEIAAMRAAKKKQANKSTSAALPFLQTGLAFLMVCGVLFGGAKFMLLQAEEHADNALKARTAVIIRDAANEVMDGRFVYLRDFGSALLVAELDAEGTQIVARRLIKASSYSGYSLLGPTPAAKQ